jgi:hypothetical protein
MRKSTEIGSKLFRALQGGERGALADVFIRQSSSKQKQYSWRLQLPDLQRPIQWYHSRAYLIWSVGPFKEVL